MLLYLINQFPYYSDYFYQNRSNPNYAIRGGRASNNTACGAFLVNIDAIAANPYWGPGAAISY